MIATVSMFALAGVSLASCSPGGGGGDDAGGGGGGGGSSGGSDCTAAGGQCLVGAAVCAVQGSQSCGAPVAAGQICCLVQIADCGQPSEVSYACGAIDDGGAGCQASALGLSAEQAGDEDASYPVGCVATLPACNNGHVPDCTCVSRVVPGWSCAY